MGVSVYPADGDSAEALISRADAASYRAKQDGGDRFQIYADDMIPTPAKKKKSRKGKKP